MTTDEARAIRVKCPSCVATPGECCWAISGPMRRVDRPHRERVAAARSLLLTDDIPAGLRVEVDARDLFWLLARVAAAERDRAMRAIIDGVDPAPVAPEHARAAAALRAAIGAPSGG